MIGSLIQLSAQGIPVPTATGKAIQKDLAELDRLRLDNVADSLTIHALDSAYQQSQLAVDQAHISLQLAQQINSNSGAMLELERQNSKAWKKKAKKQSFLKWLALTGMAGIAILAVARE